MQTTTSFKKIEKRLYAGVINICSIIWKFTKSFFSTIKNVFSQKLTIMMIPHSEKKVFNFRINVFALSLATISLVATLAVITFLSVDNYNKSIKYMDVSLKTQLNERKSREYEEIMSQIFESHRAYKGQLNNLLTKLNSPGIKTMEESYYLNSKQGGELNLIEKNNLSDLEYMKMEAQNLLMDYDFSVKAFNEINSKVNNYDKILKDLPFANPVKGHYFITSTFGLRIHPIFKYLDHHTGIDLANEFGTPIVATAPGTVEKVQSSNFGYGNYVVIRHKLGFSTLYAHMRSYVVTPGEQIKKNQIIGYMGSTGYSTGVHLHYEVRIANKPVDPWSYLNVD